LCQRETPECPIERHEMCQRKTPECPIERHEKCQMRTHYICQGLYQGGGQKDLRE